MKKVLLALAVVSASFSACVKVNIDDSLTNNGGTGGNTDCNDGTKEEKIICSKIITGQITENVTLPKGKYMLKGYVYVSNRAVLTLAAGSVIVSDTVSKGALIVERNSRLYAEGTAAEPIVFTSGKKPGDRKPGDWGGIILLGNAPTNHATTPTIEGGVNAQYGGSIAADNSGSLKYVRIEFAGIASDPGSEINGLTLGGVGSGTTLENIQVSFGNDDAYEFFGGTVNAKNLVAFATADDDFDFDNGYSGRIQFAVSCRKPDFVDPGDAGNGIECDNNAGGTTATPRTRPQLSNFTIIGPNSPTAAANHNYSNRWRRATQFVLRNSILMGHPDAGFSMESDETLNDYYTNNISEFKNNLVHAENNPYRSNNSALVSAAMIKAKAESEGCITYTNIADIQLESPFYSTNPNFLPKSGSPALSGTDFTGMTGFTAVAYRGAFGTTNWTAGWTNWDPQNTVY
ncbi:MAG: hypothetical protein J0H92_06820 [Sphingobacteriales bacterium]|nr:hypothetical protein [Sphingobacteriales bacterium]OJW32645.1 MAG: hypothetical protein BGO54_19910 [Sphingobacteriales bacterium 46-32]